MLHIFVTGDEPTAPEDTPAESTRSSGSHTTDSNTQGMSKLLLWKAARALVREMIRASC